MGFWLNIRGSISLNSFDSDSGVLILLERYILKEISNDWKSEYSGNIAPVYENVTEKESNKIGTRFMNNLQYIKGYIIDFKFRTEESLDEFKEKFYAYIEALDRLDILESIELILLDVSNTLEGTEIFKYENKNIFCFNESAEVFPIKNLLLKGECDDD